MRAVTLVIHVDIANVTWPILIDLKDQIHDTGRFRELRYGIDRREIVAHFAVVAQHSLHIFRQHPRIEFLAHFLFGIFLQTRSLNNLVAFIGNAANCVTHALFDCIQQLHVGLVR